jgi:hypothetical protein
MITLKVNGIKKTVTSFRDKGKDIKLRGEVFPLRVAKIVAKNIKQVINSKSYSRHPQHGPYRRASGKGISDAIGAIRMDKTFAIVRIDPAAKAGGTGPDDYALAMEYGGSGTASRPTNYIKEGIRKGLAEYRNKQVK